jgi:hypothetical protein
MRKTQDKSKDRKPEKDYKKRTMMLTPLEAYKN